MIPKSIMENSVADTSRSGEGITLGASITPLPLPRVSSYLVWSILSACYFPPLGIVAVGFSIACKRALSAGHRGSAAKKSKIAFYCNVISPIGAIIIALFALVSIKGGHITYIHDVVFVYVKTLKNAVERYTLDVGQPPTTEQGLQALIAMPPDLPNPNVWGGPYICPDASLLDPWGNEYRYASPGRDGRPFDVWSAGRDGIDGTDDDIGSWMDREMLRNYHKRYR